MKEMVQVLGLALMVGVFALSCSKSVSIDTDNQKASYAIGHQIGKSLKKQAKDVELKVLYAAVEDVMSGKEPKMSEADMRKAIMNLQRKYMDDQRKEAETNKKAGADFLEKNKKADGVKVTDSGLQYKVLKEGSGKTPKETDRVQVHYKGTLTNGEEFDSSYAREKPAEFGVTGVIKGWTEALKMMKVGAKWKLFIPPELAYGSVPRPKIPANSVLVFEVELLEILDKNAKKKPPVMAPKKKK
jgi:FKBP-type peptidyl-prolyl cis-trans isomerase FkpA/FKBP-type peptidyl-prolyl cis-trans isomerase FklB